MGYTVFAANEAGSDPFQTAVRLSQLRESLHAKDKDAPFPPVVFLSTVKAPTGKSLLKVVRTQDDKKEELVVAGGAPGAFYSTEDIMQQCGQSELTPSLPKADASPAMEPVGISSKGAAPLKGLNLLVVCSLAGGVKGEAIWMAVVETVSVRAKASVLAAAQGQIPVTVRAKSAVASVSLVVLHDKGTREEVLCSGNTAVELEAKLKERYPAV